LPPQQDKAEYFEAQAKRARDHQSTLCLRIGYRAASVFPASCRKIAVCPHNWLHDVNPPHAIIFSVERSGSTENF